MKRLLIKLAMTTAVVVPLAACGDSDKMDDVAVTPPPPTTSVPPPFVIATAPLESLGGGFAGLFRADANLEPVRDPTDADLVAISFTTEPAEIIGI